MTELYEKISDENFELILRSLEERSKMPDFTLQNIIGELDSLYKYEGLDGEGRGEVKQAELEGSILAYEVFIDRIKHPEKAQ